MSTLLVAGQDYPRNYREFVMMFPDNETCASYLFGLRWPRVFICPSCGTEMDAWLQSRGRLLCSSCRHQTTVTAGTIFDKTRTLLTIWFEAAWHLTTAKNGMSAKTLQNTLGTGYRVAWTLLQRYRVAMVRTDRKPLSGNVEIDETFVGGVERGAKRGRGAHKCVVVIAVEIIEPKGFGRIRMRHVPDASAKSLVPFVQEVVAPGSVIITDGWGGYNELPMLGFVRTKLVLSESGDPAHVTMPGVHRVASLLKRWILGTHQGSVDSTYLQAYLEEFTFRFNRRTSNYRGLLFRRLIEQAVATGPITEADLTSGNAWQ
jgi:transposase-like protein